MRRILFTFTSLFAVAVAAVLASCSSDPATGYVSGTLQAVGGPPLLPPRSLNGTVTLRSSTGESFSAAVGADGAFSIQVPVGTYTVTGRSPALPRGSVGLPWLRPGHGDEGHHEHGGRELPGEVGENST